MTKKRLNISSLVYIIARYAELCPWCSRVERDEQIVRTSLCAWSCYRRKCAIFPLVKDLYTYKRILAAPIGNCDYIRRVGFLYAVALSFTVLLLVFRVVALYKNSKYAIGFFGLSWLAFLANSIVVSMGVVGMQIENTLYCVEIKFQTESILGAIGPIIHDVLIFLAAAWILMQNIYRSECEKFF